MSLSKNFKFYPLKVMIPDSDIKGEQNIVVAIILNNMATTLKELGEFTEALNIIQRAKGT
jgi:hypothetical protein